MSGPTNLADTKWRCVPRPLILWAELDGEFAAYHRPSGRTHFLNSASHELLTGILAEACSIEVAARALHEWPMDQECDPEVLWQATETLLRLEQIGLIERV